MIDYKIQIKKIKIENFRLFNNIEIDFSNDNYFTFVGKNGLGKTSLLEAINICLSENSSKFNSISEDDFHSEQPIVFTVELNNPFFLSLDTSGYERLFPCKRIIKTIKHRQRSTGDLFSNPFTIEINYNLMNYLRLSNKEYDDRFGQFKNLLSAKQQIVWSINEKISTIIYTIKNNQTEREIQKNSLASASKVLYPKIFYFDKNRERELLLNYNTTLFNISKELNWKFKYGLSKEKNQEIKTQYQDSYDKLHIGIQDIEELKAKLLKPSLNYLKEAFNIEYPVDKFNFYLFDNEQPFSNLILGHFSHNNKLINVSKAGSGISILTILSLLLSFSEQTKTPIIILIDEPELHLHSDIQKNLLEFLSKKSFQCICATHSQLFLDKIKSANNFQFTNDSFNKTNVQQCSQITLASTIFDLLGNSLDDLYIPENLILVEGKYDKVIIHKCLELLNKNELKILITSCGGYTEIPESGSKLENFFNNHIQRDTWYSKYIQNNFKIIVDGDVDTTKVVSWKTKFSFDDRRIKKLDVLSTEYLYPESLIKELVSGKTLSDGTILNELDKDSIIKIIIDDEKSSTRNKKQKPDERISKQRLTEYVSNNLTLKILKSEESKNLLELIEWIMKPISEPYKEGINNVNQQSI